MVYSEISREVHNQSIRDWIEKSDIEDFDEPIESRIQGELFDLNFIYQRTIGKVHGGDKKISDVSDEDLNELRTRAAQFRKKIDEILPPGILE